MSVTRRENRAHHHPHRTEKRRRAVASDGKSSLVFAPSIARRMAGSTRDRPWPVGCSWDATSCIERSGSSRPPSPRRRVCGNRAGRRDGIPRTPRRPERPRLAGARALDRSASPREGRDGPRYRRSRRRRPRPRRAARPRLAHDRRWRHLQRDGPRAAPRRYGGAARGHRLSDPHDRRGPRVARHRPGRERARRRKRIHVRELPRRHRRRLPRRLLRFFLRGGGLVPRHERVELVPLLERRRHRHREPVLQRLAAPLRASSASRRSSEIDPDEQDTYDMVGGRARGVRGVRSARTVRARSTSSPTARAATFPGIPQSTSPRGHRHDDRGGRERLRRTRRPRLPRQGRDGPHDDREKLPLRIGPSRSSRIVRATIADDDGAMPEVLLSDVDVPVGATEVALPLALSDDQVVSYLSAQGKVDVGLELTGTIPDRPITLTHSLVAHVSVDVAADRSRSSEAKTTCERRNVARLVTTCTRWAQEFSAQVRRSVPAWFDSKQVTSWQALQAASFPQASVCEQQLAARHTAQVSVVSVTVQVLCFRRSWWCLGRRTHAAPEASAEAAGGRPRGALAIARRRAPAARRAHESQPDQGEPPSRPTAPPMHDSIPPIARTHFGVKERAKRQTRTR